MMLTLDTLTVADFRPLFQTSSLSRARPYLSRIQKPCRQGNRLTAVVRGTRAYDVEVQVGPAGILSLCSCPYDWGGLCKHVGAVLLKWVKEPETFTVISSDPAEQEPWQWLEVEQAMASEPKSLPEWMQSSFDVRQTAGRTRLQRWLEAYRLADLRGLASRQGWKAAGTRKQEVLDQVVDHLLDPTFMVALWDRLDPAQQMVFRVLALLGPADSVERDHYLGLLSAMGAKVDSAGFDRAYAELYQLGLAFVKDDDETLGRPVPKRLSEPIIRALNPLLAGVVPTVDEGELVRSGGQLVPADPLPFVRALNQVLILLSKAPVPLHSPRPRLQLERYYPLLAGWDYHPSEVKQAATEGLLRRNANLFLTVPPPAPIFSAQDTERFLPLVQDEPQLAFILALLKATGLVMPGTPMTVRPAVFETYSQMDERAQRAVLARSSFTATNCFPLWDLLRADSALALQRRFEHFQYQHLLLEVQAVLHRVLRFLASLPPGAWIETDVFFQLLRPAWPVFGSGQELPYRPAYWLPNWRLIDTDSNLPLDTQNPAGWDRAQGELLRQFIGGPLHWLGLADMCVENGRLRAFRLHSLDDLFWDRVEVPLASALPPEREARPEQAPQVVQIEADAMIVNAASAGPQVHLLLDKIARLELAEPGRFVYRLDVQAAYESYEEGTSLAEIEAEWREIIRQPLPSDLAGPLGRWWENYGRVHLYQNLTVLELGDDYALAEVKATTSLEQVMVAEISPRLVVIPREAVDVLVDELTGAGYTPRVDG